MVSSIINAAVLKSKEPGRLMELLFETVSLGYTAILKRDNDRPGTFFLTVGRSDDSATFHGTPHQITTWAVQWVSDCQAESEVVA